MKRKITLLLAICLLLAIVVMPTALAANKDCPKHYEAFVYTGRYRLTDPSQAEIVCAYCLKDPLWLIIFESMVYTPSMLAKGYIE